MIDGVRCYSDYRNLPERVDSALLVLPGTKAISAIRKAAASGIRRIWLQQGAESPSVLNAARDLGLDVISGECILMFAHPTSYHKVHRWIWGLLDKLPA